MAFDSSQQRFNIVASPLIPQDCLMFLRDEQVTAEPEASRNLHKYHMLWFCISGRGCLLIDNVPYVLSAGEAVLLTPGQPHCRKSLNGEKVQWLVIRFSLEHEPEWLTLMRNQLFCFEGEISELLADFQAACVRHRDKTESGTAAGECILRLALLLNSLRGIAGSGVTSPGAGSIPAVQRFCQRLVSSPGDGKTFAELAREQGYSAGHLRMLFKQATGKTPTKARKDERRRRAENLLTHSDLNISEIATRLGFESIYAFSRFFKKVNGISPLKYRNKMR